MTKSKVSIFHVNASKSEARQVHPNRGEKLSPEEVNDLLGRSNATLRPCGNGNLILQTKRLPNMTVKLPVAPSESLNARVEENVTTWFPGEEVILLVESSSSHLS